MTMTLVRTPYTPDDEQAKSFAAIAFGMVQGLGEKDMKLWKTFWRKWFRAEPGEIAKINLTMPRNAAFHRKFFALLQVGFDAWEPEANRVRRKWKGQTIEKNPDQFRHDVTILAGFFDTSYALDGTLKLTAKSIAFANMDDIEFEKLYNSVATVLLQKILRNYVRDDLDAVVDKMLAFT